MSVSLRIVFASSFGVAGCSESVVRRYSLPARIACWPFIANTSWVVGSVPLSRAEPALIAVCTFWYAAHTFALASATCWSLYVGWGGGLLFGNGRNQPTIATPRVTRRAMTRNANIGHCRLRAGGIAGGQGGGPGGTFGGGGRSDTG